MIRRTIVPLPYRALQADLLTNGWIKSEPDWMASVSRIEHWRKGNMAILVAVANNTANVFRGAGGRIAIKNLIHRGRPLI